MNHPSETRKSKQVGTSSDDLLDQLFVKVLHKMTVEKKYRLRDYSAARLAKELGTNSRYLSRAIASHTDGNYTTLINAYRLRDARRMLRNVRYRSSTVEEIGLLCGYASRQAFYLAFQRELHMTPRAYRLGASPAEE